MDQRFKVRTLIGTDHEGGAPVPRELKELIAHPVQVRRRMTLLGLTNRSLAARIGCADAVVGKLLCGMSIRTSAKNADAFERECGVEPGKYFAAPEVITDHREFRNRDSGEVASVDSEPSNPAVDAA